MSIRVNLYPIESTTALSYLRRKVTYNNRDQSELYINLRKAQRRWVMSENILTKMGVTIKYQVMMYKSGVQAVIIYGSEI